MQLFSQFYFYFYELLIFQQIFGLNSEFRHKLGPSKGFQSPSKKSISENKNIFISQRSELIIYVENGRILHYFCAV